MEVGGGDDLSGLGRRRSTGRVRERTEDDGIRWVVGCGREALAQDTDRLCLTIDGGRSRKRERN